MAIAVFILKEKMTLEDTLDLIILSLVIIIMVAIIILLCSVSFMFYAEAIYMFTKGV
jgi:hypothetical protein